jgi:hypothetical protein
VYQVRGPESKPQYYKKKKVFIFRGRKYFEPICNNCFFFLKETKTSGLYKWVISKGKTKKIS